MRFGMDFVFCIIASLLFRDVSPLHVSLIPSERKIVQALGKGIVMTCEVTNVYDTQGLRIQWFNSRKQPIPDVTNNPRVHTEVGNSANKKKLYVSNIQNNDAGRYTCKVTSAGQSRESYFDLTLFKAITFDDAPLFQHPSIHQDAHIKCQVSGEPEPIVSWKYNDTIPISKDMTHRRYAISKNHLFIRKVTEADNGFYTCRATVDSDGRMDERRIRVVVHVPPMIVKSIGDNRGVEGSRLTFTCNATGFPRPKFKFMKGRQTLHSNEGFEVNEDLASLTISSLKKSDEGVYTCQALNDAGDDKATGVLQVLVPPRIFEFDNITKTETEQATLVCRSHGDPAPHLTFRKHGFEHDYRLGVNDIGRIVVSLRNSRQLELQIKRLQPSDKASYTCVAKSEVGRDNMTAHLNVRYKPRYRKEDVEVFAWAGGKRDMRCEVHANPPPIVQWIRYGRVLENNMTYRISEGQSAHILTVHVRVDSDDENWIYGNYYCRAKNQVGDAQQRIKLLKATLPDAPRAKLLHKYSTMVVLGVDKPSYTGGIPITGYRVAMNKVMYEFNINDTSDYGSTSFYSEGMRIENLNPNTDYLVSVASKNRVGVGRMVNFTFRTYDKTKPQQILITSAADSKSAYQYSLVWEKPKTGGHPIKKYDIKYRKAANQNYLLDNPYTYENPGNPGDWFHVTLWDDHYDPMVSYSIGGLEPLTIYEVSIHAHNHAGRSDGSSAFKFRTSEVTEMDRVLASRSSVSVWLVLFITIIVFLLIIAAVDLTCYFVNNCGLTMYFCVKFLNKERAVGKNDVQQQLQQQPQQEQLLEKQQKMHLQLCDQQLQTTGVESSHCNVQTSSSFTDEGPQCPQQSTHLGTTADNYECKPDRRSILSQGDEKWKDVVDELEKELKTKLGERKQTEGIKSKDLVKRLSALERQPQHVVNSNLNNNGYCNSNAVSESGFVSEKATPESLLNLDASNLMETGMGRGRGMLNQGGRQEDEENLIAIRDEGDESIEIKLVDIGDNQYARGNNNNNNNDEDDEEEDEEDDEEDGGMVKNFLDDLNKNQKPSDEFTFHTFQSKPPPPPPPHLSHYASDYRKGGYPSKPKSFMPPPCDERLVDVDSPSAEDKLNARASSKQVSFDESNIIIVEQAEEKF